MLSEYEQNLSKVVTDIIIILWSVKSSKRITKYHHYCDLSKAPKECPIISKYHHYCDQSKAAKNHVQETESPHLGRRGRRWKTGLKYSEKSVKTAKPQICFLANPKTCFYPVLKLWTIEINFSSNIKMFSLRFVLSSSSVLDGVWQGKRVCRWARTFNLIKFNFTTGWRDKNIFWRKMSF